MRQPGGYTLAPGAEWTSQAATWPVTIVTRATEPGHFLTDVVPVPQRPPLKQTHLVCVNCPDLPSVFCLDPGTDLNSAYTVTAADLLSGILAHIRRSHPEVVAS